MLLRRIIHALFILAVSACVNPVDIQIPIDSSLEVVIEGSITDQPGPYTVSLHQSLSLDNSRYLGRPVPARKVTLFDDNGHRVELIEKDAGMFQTHPDGVRGTIGRSYWIEVELTDGRVVESAPDQMNPVGDIDTIYYEFETHQPDDGLTQYGYRIFINAHDQDDNKFLRWKFTGTYVVTTEPQYHVIKNCVYDPLPCSGYGLVNGELKKGYAWNPQTQTYEYVIGLECTCCRCWVTQPENKPTVSNKQISKDGKFTKVEVGYVPVNFYTFQEKYRVQVQQMSLSREAFNFWKLVEAQKLAAGSLFQPIIGQIQGNLTCRNCEDKFKGLFYAAAVRTKQIYLDKNTHRVVIDLPQDCALPPREGPAGESCLRKFLYSTTERPDDWVD